MENNSLHLPARRHSRRMLIILSLTCLLALVATSPVLAQADGWPTECLDCPRYVVNLNDRAMAIGADGRLHAAYGGDYLYYAWYDPHGHAWHVETVGDETAVGGHASLALDTAGQPHVSYYDEVNDRAMYAYRDAGGWHTQSLFSGDGGRYSSLALDAQGYPHIVYDRAELTYEYKDDTGWHREYLIVSGYAFQDISLALDSSGNPHIT